MNYSMRSKQYLHRGRKIGILLLLIILLPILFYSGYEISTLNRTEEMIGSVYARQLDVVLFSINQYLLDVASSWATKTEMLLPSGSFEEFFSNNPSVRGIAVVDTGFRMERIYSPRQHPFPGAIKVGAILAVQREQMERLFRYRRLSYRKLEPVVISSSQDSSTVALVFVPEKRSVYVALILDNRQCLTNVVGKWLADAAGDEFVLGIIHTPTHVVEFSTQPAAKVSFARERRLWLFPEYSLGIRLQGETIEDLARGRFFRNMVLILLLDVILIAGAWLIFRTIRKEMELIDVKSDFISNITHELRTPLALIRMFAETLEMDRVKTQEKKMEYYRTILGETERLTRLVNNILSFSRLEKNARKYHFRPLSLNDVVQSVLSVYAFTLSEQKFAVTMELPPKLPMVSADEEAIAEAIHNVIDNAIKYSAEEKFLRIGTSSQDGMVTLTIEDHGIGIAEEHHKKIFEKFYRVSQGLVHTAKGSGVGLALVSHIVHDHKGSVRVQSRPGRGSVFILSFPAYTKDVV
jgi:two-component system phosphate regulon sensor histidine kinase PhoR